MDNVQPLHPEDKHLGRVSLSNGYWFYFQDGDVRIAAHGSGYSGMETIYVNDAPITQARHFGLSSRHRFQFGGNRYLVRFRLDNAWTGRLICTLDKNGEHFDTATKAYYSEKRDLKQFAKLVAITFGVGFAVGVLGYKVAFMLAG